MPTVYLMKLDSAPHIYASFCEQSPDAICAVDRELRYVAWNPALEQLSGVAAKDAIGSRVFDVFPFLKYLGEAEIHRRVFSGETVLSDPRHFTQPNSEHATYLQSLYWPWRNEKDEIIGFFISTRDVGSSINHVLALKELSAAIARTSNPKETLQAALEAIRAAMGAASAFVMEFTQDGTGLTVLEYQLSAPDAVKNNFVAPLDSNWPSAIAVRTRRPVWIPDPSYLKKYADAFRIGMESAGAQAYVSVPMIVGGRIAGTLGLTFDHSRTFSAEDQSFLLSAGSACAQAYERSLLFERERKAREIAEAADRSKTLFLAGVSHELRTPMTVIVGHAELLRTTLSSLSSLEPHLSAKTISHLEAILRNSKSLARIIDDILDLSKLETGNVPITEEAFPLDTFLDDVLQVGHHLAPNKELELSATIAPEVPKVIVSDPLRLRQILVNLTSNAVKFTNSGFVKLHVSPHSPPAHAGPTSDGEAGTRPWLSFRVMDSGSGLIEGANLFEPFNKQMPVGNTHMRGSRLGLALASRLAKAMGGNLRLEDSKPGVGSTFEVVFPYTQPRPEQYPQVTVTPPKADTKSAPAQELRGLSVLIADDEPDILEILSDLLSRHGAHVFAAPDGAVAIETALTEKIDAFVLDLQMPRIDGYQTAQQLRDSAFTQPIIAVSAHVLPSDRHRALETGFDIFLPKPIEPSALIHTIKSLTTAHRGALNDDNGIHAPPNRPR